MTVNTEPRIQKALQNLNHKPLSVIRTASPGKPLQITWGFNQPETDKPPKPLSYTLDPKH